MEALPAELFQKISWFALNPELGLVSKTIKSKLPPLDSFQEDVGLLVFSRCVPFRDRADMDHHPPDRVPWRTSEAARYDHRLGDEERRTLQRLIRQQSWFSLAKFQRLAIGFCKLWIETHEKLANLPTEEKTMIQELLETAIIEQHDKFVKENGTERWCCDSGLFSVGHPIEWGTDVRSVVEFCIFH